MNGRVLVAGFSTRHVAQSAFHAGCKVCAVDHFCDQDLSWVTEDRMRFDELDELPGVVQEMAGRHRFDMLVVTSGAEDMSSDVRLCGTPPETVCRFLDKLATQNFFEDLGVPVPQLSGEQEYPAFLKPRRGAGGWRNAVIRNEGELASWEALYPDVPYLLQHVVSGIPTSVCCIADGLHARAIAANEQLLRGAEGAGFGFCGSVTPCRHEKAGQMVALAERIAAASGCIGTIGIDFMIGDGIVAIELNPRFQATVDTVERATGQNLFRLHADACTGVLPATGITYRGFAVRKILFADRDMTVLTDLKHLSPILADIPWPGTELEKDQAVTSVFGEGTSREEALAALDRNITTVRQYLT